MLLLGLGLLGGGYQLGATASVVEPAVRDRDHERLRRRLADDGEKSLASSNLGELMWVGAAGCGLAGGLLTLAAVVPSITKGGRD